ncbi:DUF4157 domain-containing protein [Streptomyces klenkii]|uniref:eCIS core domain-containing protein n=1 Tax=Streptomyces klenkii TaxID=1420899 RepID=UPI0033D47094
MRSPAITRPGGIAEQGARALADRALAATGKAGPGSTRARASAGHPAKRCAPDGGAVPANGGRPLDSSVRTEMEGAFGHDFTGVRVHSGHEASELAQALGARAYSLGRDIVLGRGESVNGPTGRNLLAHELAHVVQYDTSGRVIVARQESPRQDGRTDAQIRSELEKRTGKTFAQLVLALGRGPLDPSRISPRDLEKELERNGTLSHVEMDTKEPVVIDNVLVPHPYQENRFVSEGKIGPASKIDADKAAGEQTVRDTFVSGMATGLAGMKPGSASEGLVKPAPIARGARGAPQTRYVRVSNPRLVARYEQLANERLPGVINQTLAAERATPGRARLAALGTDFDALRAEVGDATKLSPQQRDRANTILREARDLARNDFSGLQGKAMRRLRADPALQAVENQLAAAGDARINPTGTLQVKVLRADGTEVFEPLNLEHRVRVSDNPWLAKGSQNVILTDAPQNQQYLEALRKQGSVWPTDPVEAFVVRHQLNDEAVNFAPGTR